MCRPTVSASGLIDPSGSVDVQASAGPYPGPYYANSSVVASFTGDYILTVTGGIGGGFAEPLLSAYGGSFSLNAPAGGTVSVSGNSGGCSAGNESAHTPITTVTTSQCHSCLHGNIYA